MSLLLPETLEARARVAWLVLQAVFFPLAATAATVNVNDFGAVGDGVTWDHDALQAAINAAGVGGTVEFGSGRTYVQCMQLLPLQGQTLRGNGATLKRCTAVTARLTEDAAAGALAIVVDAPGEFRARQSLTPVKGAGGFEDGEAIVNHFLQSTNGNTLVFSNGLTQDYPAGSVVTVKFDQIYVSNSSTDVTIESLLFDGNRQENDFFLAWTDNKAIRGYSGLTVADSEFRNLPGNGITVFGTNVRITGNVFLDLDGPIVHLSGNEPLNQSTVTIANNEVRNTNAQAPRMQHSEGVITISAENNSIRVIGNTVVNADVPFISRFHADMRDWIIRENLVYGTKGIFFAKVWPGSALADVVWEDNSFFNVGETRSIRNTGAEPMVGFVFRNNLVIGGHLRLDGLAGGEIVDNTIKSCGVVPLQLSDSVGVTVSGNAEDDRYCPLRLSVVAAPSVVDDPGGDVRFDVLVGNGAGLEDAVAIAGITVVAIEDTLSQAGNGVACFPPLPALLLPGEEMACHVVRNVSGNATVVNTFSAVGRIHNGSSIYASALARVRRRDTTPPVLTLMGESPQVISVGETYLESGATAADNRDGDLSSKIVIQSESLDTQIPGNYVVSYRVSDNVGNTTVRQRMVNVVDRMPPVLELIGDNPQWLEQGSAYVELGARATDNIDGDVSALIEADASQVVPARVGAYGVVYVVMDSAGNRSTPVTRAVIVTRSLQGGGGAVDVWVLLALLAALVVPQRYRSSCATNVRSLPVNRSGEKHNDLASRAQLAHYRSNG